MGNTVRCSKCKKGISLKEKWVAVEEELYHFKCLRRIESSK